jgi:DNA-binding MarR family transcriptional regulator
MYIFFTKSLSSIYFLFFLMESSKIKYALIKKMARKGYFGRRLINLSDLIKAVPSHLQGNAKRCIEELFKEGFVNRKPGTKSEVRYSLKPENKEKIKETLDRREYHV